MMFAAFFFFFNDTATTEIYTLSLHDALPISGFQVHVEDAACYDHEAFRPWRLFALAFKALRRDRKSTRLNSSHGYISYAVFCLKKKNRLLEIGHHVLVRPAEIAELDPHIVVA